MKGKVTYVYKNNMKRIIFSSSDSYEQFNSYIFYQILAIYMKQFKRLNVFDSQYSDLHPI